MRIAVREATLADVPAILDITKEAFEKYAFDMGKNQQPIHALKEGALAVEADLARKLVLIGELDGQPVGSVRCEFLPGNIAYFSRFGVKLHAQSCGMGGALVSAVVEACRAREAAALALHTNARMFSLIRFYYGKGFFIHSTSTDRGYLRALLVKELGRLSSQTTDYAALLPEGY